jgi:ABC-type Fe3+-siderophore transport system permease subunit
MPALAVGFYAYLLHDTVARVVYDEVVRPLGPLAALISLLAVGLILVRRRRRR